MSKISPKRDFIPNQVFVGLPWKNVRGKYERIIDRLHLKYPLYFTIVGRNDGQDAKDLFEIIKQRIAASSYAIFDATGGNANVSLEYGYAEGIDMPRAIYLSTHKAASKDAGTPILSDLGGKRRVQYKTENGLSQSLHTFCREHAYTQRFETFLKKSFPALEKGRKKSNRTLALKLIHCLDGAENLRRGDLIQQLQSVGYDLMEIEEMIKQLHKASLIRSEVGRYSKVWVT